MRRGYLTSVFLGLLGVGFLIAAAALLDPIYALRKEYKLQSGNPLKDKQISAELRLPPVILFTFRALAIDYLWIRAEKLKDEGQYFDALHLARMICVLQPNLASVWDFQAWNMAYNISVTLPTPQQRWDWVRAGYELLRDKGLLYNPHSLKLYRSLAWTFQHKIGGISDDHHRYYKLQLALDMTPLLTPLNSQEINSAQDIAAMAEIETDWDKFKSDPEVADLLDKIRQAEPKLSNKEKLFDGLMKIRMNPTDYTPALHQVLADNRYNQALKNLDVFVRVQKLRDNWKLEPKRMNEINKKYGPIDYENENTHLSMDWRLPWTHAIYWAVRGLESTEAKTGFDVLNLYRVIYHCLQELYHYGNLQIMAYAYPGQPKQTGPIKDVQDAPQDVKLMLFNSQDMRMFPVAYQATLDVLKTYKDANNKTPTGVRDASIYLCRAGISSFYLAGHRRLAQKYYDQLRKRDPANKDYHVSLDAFIQADMKEEIKTITPKDASDYIISLLRDSYYRYAIGDDENATIRENWALQVHKVMLVQHPASEDMTQRITLRPFRDLRRLALMDFLKDPLANPAIKEMMLTRIKNYDPALFEQVMAEWEKQNKSTKLPGKSQQK